MFIMICIGLLGFVLWIGILLIDNYFSMERTSRPKPPKPKFKLKKGQSVTFGESNPFEED